MPHCQYSNKAEIQNSNHTDIFELEVGLRKSNQSDRNTKWWHSLMMVACQGWLVKGNLRLREVPTTQAHSCE